MKKDIFLIPNEDKNVTVEETATGLKMHYVLSCPKDFPKISFISKNKAYIRKSMDIPYGIHMSKRLNYAYNKLKVHTMFELAEYKVRFYSDKYFKLLNEKEKLKAYVD